MIFTSLLEDVNTSILLLDWLLLTNNWSLGLGTFYFGFIMWSCFNVYCNVCYYSSYWKFRHSFSSTFIGDSSISKLGVGILIVFLHLLSIIDILSFFLNKPVFESNLDIVWTTFSLLLIFYIWFNFIIWASPNIFGVDWHLFRLFAFVNTTFEFMVNGSLVYGLFAISGFINLF